MAERLQKFCPECGKDVDHLVDGLCEGCYTADNDLVRRPGEIEIEVCPDCNRVHHGDTWLREADAEERVIRESLTLEGEGSLVIRLEEESVTVQAVGKMSADQEEEMTEEFSVHVRHVDELCDDCTKIRDGYYEAVLQVRGEEDDREEVLRLMEEVLKHPRGDRWFITSIEDVQGGVDVYLGSKSMLSKIHQKVKRVIPDAETEESYELKGMEDGQKVYRNFLSVKV